MPTGRAPWPWKRIVIVLGVALTFVGTALTIRHTTGSPPIGSWTHVSTTTGELAPPSASREQTAALVVDLDDDGDLDFVIGIRKEPGPSLVWYRRSDAGWDRYVIDAEPLDIEAGGAYHDIDSDGDLDLVMGGDAQSNQVWWWENPCPDYAPDQGWTRRLIKNGGATKHHDQIFGDFDGDGQTELAFWNQRAKTLFLAEIPATPRDAGPWPRRPIYTWTGPREHEGLAAADMDGDGRLDIVGGGYWFKHVAADSFRAFAIDKDMTFTRTAVGQLVPGGRPEVVLATGDAVGPIKWYRWNGSTWRAHSLRRGTVDHGHSLQILDFDDDGNLDVFNAEMRLAGGNEDAQARIFLGDGSGGFRERVALQGYGNHESRLADLDGDGDYDLLGKPHNWQTPRLDIWLNEGLVRKPLDRWRRRVIDSDRPGRAIFVAAADLNGDQRPDIVAGRWWYRNPGPGDGTWERRAIGDSLNNFAVLYDFDGDGDTDILGTGGRGAAANADFVWARNDGAGDFAILDNIDTGEGDFLQGVAVARLAPAGPLTVTLSWHESGRGVQALVVPADPATGRWTWRRLSGFSQDEQLSVGDIDRDGRPDLLLGTSWLHNQGDHWTEHTLHGTQLSPDRNRLADIDGDGRLDAVVGYESTASTQEPLAWYAQTADPTAIWPETIIARPVAPMSLDVCDLDGDGDLDVVAGEHNLKSPTSSRLLIYENTDGRGQKWRQIVVHTGDEHHDGAQAVDLDGDGDLDLISVGWTHGRVIWYENLAVEAGGALSH